MKSVFEKRDECRNAIIALTDKIVIANRPFANLLLRQLVDFESVQQVRT
jgi:hypothetical protein